MKTWAPLLGRVLLIAIFIDSGVGKIMHPTQTMGYMAAKGMPMVGLFLVLAIICELAGSLSVLLGFFTKWGAAILIIFMIPATFIFHSEFADQIQKIMFMKNVSMTGGLLLLMAFGPGEWSIDGRKSNS